MLESQTHRGLPILREVREDHDEVGAFALATDPEIGVLDQVRRKERAYRSVKSCRKDEQAGAVDNLRIFVAHRIVSPYQVARLKTRKAT